MLKRKTIIGLIFFIIIATLLAKVLYDINIKKKSNLSKEIVTNKEYLGNGEFCSQTISYEDFLAAKIFSKIDFNNFVSEIAGKKGVARIWQREAACPHEKYKCLSYIELTISKDTTEETEEVKQQYADFIKLALEITNKIKNNKEIKEIDQFEKKMLGQDQSHIVIYFQEELFNKQVLSSVINELTPLDRVLKQFKEKYNEDNPFHYRTYTFLHLPKLIINLNFPAAEETMNWLDKNKIKIGELYCCLHPYEPACMQVLN